MLAQQSLRLRIFLFFCLIAIASLGLAVTALLVGWVRADTSLPSTPFITSIIVFGFLNTGLVLGIWFLFDEHVSKPIDELSAKLRLQVHSGVDANVSIKTAQYLGDLAPAAGALTQAVSSAFMDTAAKVARETNQLQLDRERLTSLLNEIPVATILINAQLEIVLYDAQAADILSRTAPPRLKAPLSDYFAITDILKSPNNNHSEETFRLYEISGNAFFDAKVKKQGDGGYMINIVADKAKSTPIKQRPLVFDFDLIKTTESKPIFNTPLSQLCFVPFDTETTGLSVETDAIVQIGAVRVLNQRIVDAEVFDTYVNPGRAIPPSSSKIHRIYDNDVVDAPDIATAGRLFHLFARNSVLVAHNAPFDIGLLKKYQAQMGVEWNHPVVDTVLLSAVVFGITEEHSLDALCERLCINIPSVQRHTAIGDAQVTAEVLVKLIPLLVARGYQTLGQLTQETRKYNRLLQDLNV